MPSGQLPSADSDYQTDGDGFNLSITVWNALFASISQRLKDLEAVQADFDALIAAGTSDAIAVITDQVAPQMTAIQATIDAANADLTQALELLANLQANGVDASKVDRKSTRLNSSHGYISYAVFCLKKKKKKKKKQHRKKKN